MKRIARVLGIFMLFICFFSLVQVDAKALSDIRVHAVTISSFDLTCKEQITAYVTIENKGLLDASVHVELSQDELHVSSFSPTILVPHGQQQTLILPFSAAPETVGDYLFTIRLYTAKEIQQSFQTFHFQGCTKPQLTSLILAAPTEQIRFSSLLHSEENVIAHPSLPFSLMIGFILFGVLGFLSILFVLLTFWRERHE